MITQVNNTNPWYYWFDGKINLENLAKDWTNTDVNAWYKTTTSIFQYSTLRQNWY